MAVGEPKGAVAGGLAYPEYSIGEHPVLSSVTETIASAFFMTTSEAHSTRAGRDES
jgi:hypothetical protein